MTYAGQPDSGYTVWRIPLATGLPEKLLTDRRGLIHAVDWTTDGNDLVFYRIALSSDAVLISDLR